MNVLTKELRLFMVKDTVAHYRVDPVARRSVIACDKKEQLSCVYYGPNGCRCAIGRYLISPTLPKGCNESVVEDLIISYPNRSMKVNDVKFRLKDLSIFDITFLESLQDLHDSHENWSKKSITLDGLAAARELKKECLSQTA